MRWEFDNMGSISIQKMEWNLVIWDQYLSQHMKWTCGNMGAISTEKLQMKFWYRIWDQYYKKT